MSATDDPQSGLFSVDDAPIPERAAGPYQMIYVHFEDLADVPEFARVIGQPVTTETRAISFPPVVEFSDAWIANLPEPRRGDDRDEDEDAERGAEEEQGNLFGLGDWWEDFWRGMPEFDQRDLAPRHSVAVYFPKKEDVERFKRVVGQGFTAHARRTRSIWFPEAEIGRFADKRYISDAPLSPRYPIYIVSKGRWEKRLTSDHLDRLGVPHFVVVEPQEFDRYAERVRPLATPIVLDMAYKRDYDPCDDLGDTKGKGPGGARNFAWEHSRAAGHAWHWVMDDNIDGFFRLTKNLKTPVGDGTIFRAMELFVERYSNVGMAGPNYFMFASRKTRMPPFITNTRIYSCNLIRNDVPLRWRGRYNEDTDLSIRMMREAWATVQFNAFLQLKVTTQTLGGGNTAEFYAAEGTRPKSEMQVKLHPDISRLVWRFGRWHHYVDYSVFRSLKLKLRDGVSIPEGVDNLGMRLVVDESFAAARASAARPVARVSAPDATPATTPAIDRSVERVSAPDATLATAPEEDRTSIEYFAKLQREIYERGLASAREYWKKRGVALPDPRGEPNGS